MIHTTTEGEVTVHQYKVHFSRYKKIVAQNLSRLVNRALVNQPSDGCGRYGKIGTAGQKFFGFGNFKPRLQAVFSDNGNIREPVFAEMIVEALD